MDIVRITELQPKTYVEQGDYIAIDNQSDGTKKVQFTNLLDDTLSQENKIAPANVVGDEIATIRAAVGSPLKASTVAQMTDTNKIYVYVGSESGYTNGNWYYWNGSAWTSGGVYNSVAVVTDPTLTLSGVPADAKATGDEITSLKSEINEIVNDSFIDESVTLNVGYARYWNMETETAVLTSLSGSNWCAANSIPVIEGDVYRIKACQGNTHKTRIWIVTDDNYQIISTAEDYYGLDAVEESVTIPSGGTKLLLTSTGSGHGLVPPYLWAWERSSRNNINNARINDVETLFPAVDGFVFESGAISATGGTTSNNTRIRTKSGKLMQIKAGDCIYCGSAYKIRLAIFTANSITQANFVEWITEWDNGVISIPSQYADKYVALTVQKVGEESSDISADVDAVSSSIQYYSIKRSVENLATKEEVYTNDSVTIKNTYKYYWNVETSMAVKTYIDAAFLASNPIDVTEGEVYILTAQQGNTDKTRIWVVTDDDYNIVEMCENYKGTTEHTTQFTIPQGGTKLLLTKQAVSSNQSLYRICTALDIIAEMRKEEKTLTGMKLSLLGDSISAYTGTIPSGNDAYYTGSNSGVSSADEMWWSVLCTETGMIPCVINGWSGSGVTQLEDSAHVDKAPMSSDARTSALHDGDNYPDIILIAGGVNDYTYAKSAQSEPLPWDDQDIPVLGDSFTEAYACMIKKIQTNYPNAIVIGLSTWFTMRGTDNGYCLTHTSDSGNTYTQNDYNKAIEDVCYKMHIPFIRVDDIGMNRNNMYPTFAVDSSTTPTHPNAKGQRLMGEYLATQLPLVVNGYAQTI